MRLQMHEHKARIPLICCGALLCLLIGLFGLSTVGYIKMPFLENAVGTVVGPAQKAVTSLYRNISGRLEKKQTIAELNEEITRLNQTKTELDALTLENAELQKENERLKRLLDVKELNPTEEYIAASVIAKEPSGWFVTFTVDAGEEDGVSKDDPVLSGDGLVGRVLSTTQRSSVIITLIDSRSSVSGMVERTRDNGICHGSLYVNDNDELLQMNYLPSGCELSTGDRVISSGLDGIYPKGLFIGTVRSVSRDAGSDEERYVVLNPAADFKHLEEVLILHTKEDR